MENLFKEQKHHNANLSNFQPLTVSLNSKANNRHGSHGLKRQSISPNANNPDTPEVETLCDESGTIQKIIINCTCGQRLELACQYNATAESVPVANEKEASPDTSDAVANAENAST